MLSNAQNAIYINLNVDKMLPCYGTDGYRTLEADDSLSVGGYRTLESEGDTVNSTLGYHTLERDDNGSPGEYWTLEGRGDDSSIASADVAVLGAAGEAAVGPWEVATCEGDSDEETCV